MCYLTDFNCRYDNYLYVSSETKVHGSASRELEAQLSLRDFVQAPLMDIAPKNPESNSIRAWMMEEEQGRAHSNQTAFDQFWMQNSDTLDQLVGAIDKSFSGINVTASE